MAVKASVNTQNQTTVRVGQQNAIRVSSTAAGISGADTATTAVNVVGGRADVTQLAVSGLSTFTGIGTFVSDLYVGGDLYLTDDLVLDNISGSSLIISGISSLGITSVTDLEAQQLSVSGISTLGVLVSGGTTTGTLSVTGVSTFVGAVGFGTTSTYVDDAAIYFGDDNDLQIFHSGSHSWIEDTGTGNLVLKGSRIDIQDTSGNELLSVEGGQYVRLGYGATERLKTTDVGVAVSGIVTATSGIVTYYGDGTNLTGVARTDNINADSLYVSGISTFAGITTVTGHTLFTKQLSVSGFSTYIGVATYKDDVFIDGTLTAGAIDGGTY